MRRKVHVATIGLGTIVERWVDIDPAETKASVPCEVCRGRRWVHVGWEGTVIVAPCEVCNRFAGLRGLDVVDAVRAMAMHDRECACSPKGNA